jgi:hypothetical protein
MAIHRLDILGAPTLPDTSGNVYAEPAAVNFQANDRYPNLVFVFADTATRDTLGFAFQVPQNYVGTPKIGLIWATTATTGDAQWEVDLTSIADGESGDPSADQEAITATVAAPGTARLLKFTELTFTGSTFAAGDWVMGRIARDGAAAGPLDTIAASLYLLGAFFSFADA